MTTRVGVEFDGSARGALTAGRQAAGAIRQVRTEAAATSGPLRGMEQDLGKTTRGALAGSGAFRGLGRSIAFASAGFLGGFGLAAAARGAADELINQVKVGARVNAALRSTNFIAGMTAGSIDALAKAELRKTGIDDEVIKSAEAMLLRFTQVRDVTGDMSDKIFTRATRTALDLSVALGRDATDAAFALGKALNDPTRGVQQLRRVGAAFTVEEAKQIKQLAEHGHVLEAQKAILDALTRSYGGTAKAVSDVAPWMRLRETLKNLSAVAIRPLLPEMDTIVTRAQKWADGVEHNAAMQQKLKHDIEQGIGIVRDFAGAADKVAGALGGWRQTLELLLALKVASTLAGWATGLKALIGTAGAAEGAAVGAGLLGARSGATGLLGALTKLSRLGPITIAVAFSFIKPTSKGQSALDKAGIGFLGHVPILGHAFQQEAALEARLFGGSWGTSDTAPQTAPQVGKPGGAVGKAVSGYAKQYGVGSGIVYHWAGISPITGFDCSGYVYSAYASAGVTVPRDTRGQWNDPNAVKVAPGNERPGDAVYFTGSLSGKNAGPPPGHVGIYLGGGIFIEYFSEGKPAKTDNLANRPDYMGARRWLKIKDSKGAAPPTSGPTTQTGNIIPSKIRQAIAAANVSVASAALTPGKADDKAAIQESKQALEAEITWIRAKLATNVGAEKRITLEDLLTGALGDLAGLTPDGKKKAGASISTITSLRAAVNATLRDLPATLDDVERQAVSKLTTLRDHLKVGMKAKDLADTRASIKRWGVVLSDEITKQAAIAADAAQSAAAAWQRGWQNDVNRVLRDFQENVVDRQLAQFDRDTAAHLQGLQEKYGAKTLEEQALASFDAANAAADEAKQRADIAQQIIDTQAQLDALGTGSSGTLIDITTGQRTPLAGTDLVSQRKAFLDQLQNLNDQSALLDRQDQRAALQDAADLSRQAADRKLAAEQAEYQTGRDAARTALNDRLSDEQAALAQSLDDWQVNIEKKKASWSEFIGWLKAHGYDTVGIFDPNPQTAPVGLAGAAAAAAIAGRLFGQAQGFATGGRVPGGFYGRQDTVMARLTPTEEVLDTSLSSDLRAFLHGGRAGGRMVTIVEIDGREIVRQTSEPMTSEQARRIGYTLQRG